MEEITADLLQFVAVDSDPEPVRGRADDQVARRSRTEIPFRTLDVEEQAAEPGVVAGDLLEIRFWEKCLELPEYEVEQALVDVRTAQGAVTVRGNHRHLAGRHPQHGGVECAAAQVVDQDAAITGRGQTVVHGRRDGFVEQLENIEPGDPARLRGRLALGRAEVGRDGDHDLRGPPHPGRGAELTEDQSGDGLRRVVLLPQPERELGAHLPLDQHDSVAGIDRCQLLGLLADHRLTGGFEVHGGRRGLLPRGISQHDHAPPRIEGGNHRIGGAEVDPEHLRCHPKSTSVL